jgi:quercetin dioxygenase-like cupin family protein
MKLLFFDDFKLSVLKGDTVVDVSQATRDIPAVLYGDPSKPGPYIMRIKWLPGNMSRPHFHPNDRFFVVLAGTWWMGTGGKLRHSLRGQGSLRRR